MNARYSLDPDDFQLFLANAFAVQKSGLDRESLCALIELERFIITGDFDEDRALQMVADRALKVANAGGVSIALLQGNELVYRAGSGSAAHEVGHHVPAVLSVSPGAEARREIVRVENAQTDTRVEADVCRQFGANSLLMLPIHQNGILAGVMQVLFDDAHAFLDREMRTYRLMVGVLEERILLHPGRAQLCAVGAAGQITDSRIDSQDQLCEKAVTSTIDPDAVEQNTSQRAARRTNDDHAVHMVREPVRGRRAFVSRKLRVMRRGLNRAVWNDGDPSSTVRFWRGGAAGTAAIMLGLAIWASYYNQITPATSGLAFSKVRGTGQQAQGQRLSVESTKTQVNDGRKHTTAPNSAFRRIRIGPDEVDYIAEDVTIKQFKIVSAKPQTQSSEKEVNFGDDVTVRYFAYTPTTLGTLRTNSAATATTKHIVPASR